MSVDVIAIAVACSVVYYLENVTMLNTNCHNTKFIWAQARMRYLLPHIAGSIQIEKVCKV